MTQEQIELLRSVFLVLDDLLGDTDPDISGMTDEEIRTEEPLFWAAREIDRLIHWK